jgi:hypothetical protein
MSNDLRSYAVASVIFLSAGSCYQAPEKPAVSLVAIRAREQDDNEDQEPEQQIEDPVVTEISIGVSDTLRLTVID